MTAWLAERLLPNGNLSAFYITPCGIQANPHTAIRCARKADAEALALLYQHLNSSSTARFRAVEHGWED